MYKLIRFLFIDWFVYQLQARTAGKEFAEAVEIGGCLRIPCKKPEFYLKLFLAIILQDCLFIYICVCSLLIFNC